MWMRRVNKTNIKNPQAKIKCEYWTVVKQKPIGSGPIYSAVQVGGARSELHAVQCSWVGGARSKLHGYAVQWGGRGSKPTSLGRPLGSKFNFRKKMAQMLLAVRPTDNTEADQKECGWKFCYPKLQPASSEWVSLTLPFPP